MGDFSFVGRTLVLPRSDPTASPFRFSWAEEVRRARRRKWSNPDGTPETPPSIV